MKHFVYKKDNLIAALIGLILGILMQNLYLAIVFCFCFALVPSYKREIDKINEFKYISNSLHHSLNLVTGTYLQTEDIVFSIKDNLDRIKDPLKHIMSQFLAEANYVDVNLVSCLKRMKSRLENKYFQAWCDTLIQCQYDRGLKFALNAHIEKMADAKKMQDELDTKMIEVYRDLSGVAVVAFFSYPLMRIINKDWFLILSNTNAGKIAVAVTYLTIFLSIAYAIKVNKPVMIS